MTRVNCSPVHSRRTCIPQKGLETLSRQRCWPILAILGKAVIKSLTYNETAVKKMALESFGPANLHVRMSTKLIANFDFGATEAGQLSFDKGDVIVLIEKDDSGWWHGYIQGDRNRHGLFPYNYVQELKADETGTVPTQGVTVCNSPASELRSGMKTPTIEQKSHIPMEERSNAYMKVVLNSPKSPVAESGLGRILDPSNVQLIVSEDRKEALEAVQVHYPRPPGGKPPGARPYLSKVERKRAKKGTVFRVYAHVMIAYGCSMGLFLLGLCAVIYGGFGRGMATLEIVLGFFAIFLGPSLYFFETLRNGEPLVENVHIHSNGCPVRASVWILFGIAFCGSFVLVTMGVVMIIAAIVDIVGFKRNEIWQKPQKKKKLKDAPGCCEAFGRKIQMEIGKGRKFIFCLVYIIANLLAFILTAIIWKAAIDAMDEDKKLSQLAPFAKSFGAIIDINSSLILLPICRTMLRMLYNVSTRDQSCTAVCLREIFTFIPIDKNHMLHIQLAKITLFGVIGHTVAHYINYSYKPDQTLARFGLWPFLSGMILLVIMVFIYAGGFEIVKRQTFEIFWYSHHLFFVYFLITLVHGTGGFNPNFWKYFLIPGLLYLAERFQRIFRSKKKVKLVSVMTMEPKLISLEFDKFSAFPQGYHEGQYVFLNCPSVAEYEWHPFTISSPPAKETFTLHIQTQGPGSWTQGMKDFVTSMAPRGAASFQLTSRDNRGVVSKGRTHGPDGKQIFLIDGPHAAPTQHMTEYNHSLVAGAGIGLTPVAACAQSVVFHRWPKAVGNKCYPSHAHFAWVVSYRDIKAYRWFISMLQEIQESVVNLRRKSPETMATKTFKFHIYVTSVPKDLTEEKAFFGLEDDSKDPNFWGLPAPKPKIFIQRSDFSKMDLYKAVLCPQKGKNLGDIYIHNGRPKWDERFEEMTKTHPNEHIGVMFCGNRYIGSDLKKACKKHTKASQIYTLHKENF
ncbi:hypothetical protein AAMO2058_000820400 [Amorphochlora amoebiformis]